jgi:hypothetical protein
MDLFDQFLQRGGECEFRGGDDKVSRVWLLRFDVKRGKRRDARATISTLGHEEAARFPFARAADQRR